MHVLRASYEAMKYRQKMRARALFAICVTKILPEEQDWWLQENQNFSYQPTNTEDLKSTNAS